MYETKCGMCGAPIVYQYQWQSKRFCGKKCLGQFLHQKRDREVCDWKQPRSRYIHPDGYSNLVCAIVKQAKDDVMSYAPTNPIRQDAEDFFLSEFFEALTNLDGFEILDRLTQKYDERQRKKSERGRKHVSGNA